LQLIHSNRNSKLQRAVRAALSRVDTGMFGISVINQIRGLLLVRGITLLKGRRYVEEALPGILGARCTLPMEGRNSSVWIFPAMCKDGSMVGFIFMIDDFTPENGATCFMRGSQGCKASSSLVPACGPSGSVLCSTGRCGSHPPPEAGHFMVKAPFSPPRWAA
jgi:hypothetical protein